MGGVVILNIKIVEFRCFFIEDITHAEHHIYGFNLKEKI